MKIYTLSLLMTASAFLAGNALAGVEMATGSSQPPPPAVVTTYVSRDSGCGCSTPPKPIHFIDGIPSNGPVKGDPAYADPEGNDGCGCSKAFGFRDYGPARVVPPPAPDTKEMKSGS